MKHRGQYTINSSSQPLLSKVLESEPSAKKRSAAVVAFAEIGCVMQGLAANGLLDPTALALVMKHVPTRVIARRSPAEEHLTAQLLDNAIEEFSFSSTDLEDTE